ncbi:MFS transporter [Nesterenkonia ebinurensis]|uniref:MFS transporter n=1 Tax=Nesterenkonia ebinurensis TaxID=2608252 RepID=UPI00123DA9EE|nr:MFS transporter [Nesterenkonia ebinurensis]
MSTTADTAVAPAPEPENPNKHDEIADENLTVPRRRIIGASLIGTTIEFYDFYIFATAAASIFPLLFFYGDDNDLGRSLLLSMTTFGVAFVARPLGAIVFGHYGDKIGRKVTLVGALLVMGIATVLIGFLPTYHQIGMWAPAMLTVLRFCQGLGLGGEWSGAALLASETARPGKRAQAAMWPQLGAPFGFILANGLFLLLAVSFSFNLADVGNMPFEEALAHPFLVWGWRIPFIASLIMIAVGLYVRLRIEETPVFAKALENKEKVKAPVGEVFRKNWWEIILGTFIMLATYGLFYIMTTWIATYVVQPESVGSLGYDYQTFLMLQVISIVLFAVFIPVAGRLADAFGRRRMLMGTTAAIIVFGLSFGWFIGAEQLGTGEDLNVWQLFAFLCVGMALMGLTFGPMSAYLPELFPTNTRYTGSGVAYNFSSILGAALTPFVATWLVQNYGVGAVGLYLVFLSALTMISLILSPETSQKSLYTEGTE